VFSSTQSLDNTIVLLDDRAGRKSISGWETGAEDHWHSYVMIYYEKEVDIVDPEYAGAVQWQERVRYFVGLGLVKGLLPYIYQTSRWQAGWARPIDWIRIGAMYQVWISRSNEV